MFKVNNKDTRTTPIAKVGSKLFPSVGELVWAFGHLLLVFRAFGCLTVLPFVCKTFSILRNVKCGFCFKTVFHCCLLIHHSVFWIVTHRGSSCPHYSHDQNCCLHLKVPQFARFPLPSSLLKYILSDPLIWTLTYQQCFICFSESPLKMIINAFYFILKSLFVNFSLDFLVM